MRFTNFLNELASEYGKGITFIDLDNTIFSTFAMIYVIDDKSGKVVKKLSNQEFNTYKLPPNHRFDFCEFVDAKKFRETSIAIDSTINRIKRMFLNLEYRGSKIVLLTARSTFDNMKEFNLTFKDYGIPIDKIRIEFVGDRNDKSSSVSQEKRRVLMNYLKNGEYRRCRLIDDDMKNIKDFLTIEKDLSDSIINKVKERYGIPDDETFPVIQFFGLLVKKDGSLKRIGG
jgi:hypothetical protein